MKIILSVVAAIAIPLAVMAFMLAWVAASYAGPGWFGWLVRAVTGR